MPNYYLSVLYKHIIQVENKNVGLKVGGHKHTIAPPVKKVGGHMPPLPPPLPTPVICIVRGHRMFRAILHFTVLNISCFNTPTFSSCTFICMCGFVCFCWGFFCVFSKRVVI